MAATVTLDFIEGSASSHDLLSGWDYTRVALVEFGSIGELPLGSSGAGSTDGLISYAQRILSITTDGSPGVVLTNQPVGMTAGTVGIRGARYQMMGNSGTYNQDGSANNGVYVYLKQFIPEVLSPTAVKFRIVYRGYPILVYDFDGALCQIESNTDVAGRDIFVSFTFPANYEYNDQWRGTRKTQGVWTARVQPEPVFTVKFLVTQLASNMVLHIRGQTIMLNVGENATNVMTALGAFSGTTNDDVYTIGIITGTKHTWMVNVKGHSEDQGLTYQAEMSFHYRPSGWDKLVVFTDPNTGLPPPGLIKSTVKVTDNTFPQYAGSETAGTPDIGATLAAIADESTFPSFGAVNNATFPAVQN